MLSTRPRLAHSVARRNRVLLSGSRLSNARRCIKVSADQDNGDKEKAPDSKAQDVSPEKLRAAVEKLKADGVDEKVARKVLQAWKDQDVEDASKFSEKTRGLGVSRVALGTVQVFTDLLAAYCCSATATAFGGASSFGAEALGFIFQLLFFYFATGVLLDLFRLGAVIATASGLGADSKTLYAAIETLAGENSGLAIVDKAQAAVSSTKVVLALNSVRRILKEEMDDAAFTEGTLAQLSAYFVVSDAEKKGFKVSGVPGLTQEGATKAAGVFAKYDSNDDYKLEMNEFKRLCDDADFTLNDEEVKAAMGMMDKNGNGVVEFDEFATWWAALPAKAP